MSAANALAYAKKLTQDMPLDVNYANTYFGCTRWFYNALRNNFQGFDLESTKTLLENGMDGININGVTFVNIPEWDWLINRYHNDGTKWYKPHRVMLMRKDNLLLGVPSTSTWGEFEMFYDKTDRKFYIDIKDEFDTQIQQDTQLVYGI